MDDVPSTCSSGSSILSELRTGGFPSVEEALRASRIPALDRHRQFVQRDDVELLLGLAQRNQVELACLGIALLKEVQDEKCVQDWLWGTWGRPPSYDHAWWIMFRLLHLPDLESERHHEIFCFVTSSWDRWRRRVVEHFGPPEAALEHLENRMGSSRWLDHNSWVRVLQAACYDDERAWNHVMRTCRARRGEPILLREAAEFVCTQNSWTVVP